MITAGFEWTEERVERAKSMWIAGSSASEIARTLGGISRNAVIGKITRAGLTRQVGFTSTVRREPAAPRRVYPKAPRPVASPKRPRGVKSATVWSVAPASENAPAAVIVFEANAPTAIDIDGLQGRACKFPVGEATGMDQMFRGARREEDDDAYCPAHRQRCGGKRSPLAKTVIIPGYARR